MDTIRSSEFRKVYSTLTQRVAVTVNGHVIGVYEPTVRPTITITTHVTDPTKPEGVIVDRPFAEFRPAPKPGKGE